MKTLFICPLRSRNFHKELREPKLELLTACRNCVKEWIDSIRIIVEKSECFVTKLNLRLLSKYLPKFDQFSDNFPMITAYIPIYQQSLNLMDLEQIEKLKAGQVNFEIRSMPVLDGAQPRQIDAKLLALVDLSSNLMCYSGLLNANVDLDVYVDRVRAIEAMVGNVQSADWREKSKD
ncbi:hypothetical protein BpHYR1_041727 [Brachionus plicatilis]|uniref:Uncharacterized protein n=1 Tax=Brachionus plicatilis TaxID=10195 RepID=A0A3M7S761_BRAPC|nr:hypothetical protein BpHYR1_041727 [Brachionus plicatilis]